MAYRYSYVNHTGRPVADFTALKEIATNNIGVRNDGALQYVCDNEHGRGGLYRLYTNNSTTEDLTNYDVIAPTNLTSARWIRQSINALRTTIVGTPKIKKFYDNTNQIEFGAPEQMTTLSVVNSTVTGKNYKGNIAISTNFPTNPSLNDSYVIVTPQVSDPYHANQTFYQGDVIYWTGSTWSIFTGRIITLPDTANTNDTIALIGKSQTFTGANTFAQNSTENYAVSITNTNANGKCLSVGGIATFTGLATFNGGIAFSSGADINGAVTITNASATTPTLQVTNSLAGGGASITGGLTVATGGATITGDVKVESNSLKLKASYYATVAAAVQTVSDKTYYIPDAVADANFIMSSVAASQSIINSATSGVGLTISNGAAANNAATLAVANHASSTATGPLATFTNNSSDTSGTSYAVSISNSNALNTASALLLFNNSTASTATIYNNGAGFGLNVTAGGVRFVKQSNIFEVNSTYGASVTGAAYVAGAATITAGLTVVDNGASITSGSNSLVVNGSYAASISGTTLITGATTIAGSGNGLIINNGNLTLSSGSVGITYTGSSTALAIANTNASESTGPLLTLANLYAANSATVAAIASNSTSGNVLAVTNSSSGTALTVSSTSGTGLSVTAGSNMLVVNNNYGADITGAARIASGLTIATGGLTVTAGGLTVNSGSVSLATGNSLILAGGDLTLSSGTASITNSTTASAALTLTNSYTAGTALSATAGSNVLVVNNNYGADITGAARIASGLSITSGGLTVTAGGTSIKYDDNHKLIVDVSYGADITGPIRANSLTANRALYLDADKKFASSAVTNTELGYLSGVTSTVQSQINSKEPTIAAGATSQYWRGDKTWQTHALTSLTDTSISTPSVDQILRYNGAKWVNSGNSGASAGSSSVLFLDYTPFLSVSTQNNLAVKTLSSTPTIVAGGKTDSVSIPASDGSTPSYAAICAYFYNTALYGSRVDAGPWDIYTYCKVSQLGSSSVLINAYRVRAISGTITVTGSGTSRTVSSTAGLFLTTDASSIVQLASYLQTAKGLYQIIAYSGINTITISVPADYINETVTSCNKWEYLFGAESENILSTDNYIITDASVVANQYTIDTTDKMGFVYFGKTLNTSATTLTYNYNSATQYSDAYTPLISRHNNLYGLQGGTNDQFYHLTLDAYNNLANTNQTINTGSAPSFSALTISGTSGVNLSNNSGNILYITRRQSGALSSLASKKVVIYDGDATDNNYSYHGLSVTSGQFNLHTDAQADLVCYTGNSGRTSTDEVFRIFGNRSSGIKITVAGGSVTLKPDAFTAAVTYTMPALTGVSAANFVLDQGAQTINGLKTFSSVLALTGGVTIGGVGNGLRVASGNVLLDSGYIEVSQQGSIKPALTLSNSYVNGVGLYVAQGGAAITGDVKIESNSLKLKSTNYAIIAAATHSSDRTYTLPDAGGSANFILSTSSGGQTIANSATSGNALTITQAASNASAALNVTNNAGGSGLAVTGSVTVVGYGAGNGGSLTVNNNTSGGGNLYVNGGTTYGGQLIIGNGGSYNAKIGVGVTSPSALLSLSTTSTELASSVASSTFRTNAGDFSLAQGSTLKLASLGFSCVDNSPATHYLSLGIKARRAVLQTQSGSSWRGTAIGLGIDVDSADHLGGCALWLHTSSVDYAGSVEIGNYAASSGPTTQPTELLRVNGNTKIVDYLSQGTNLAAPLLTVSSAGNGNGEYPLVYIRNGSSLGGTQPSKILRIGYGDGSWGIDLSQYAVNDDIHYAIDGRPLILNNIGGNVISVTALKSSNTSASPTVTATNYGNGLGLLVTGAAAITNNSNTKSLISSSLTYDLGTNTVTCVTPTAHGLVTGQIVTISGGTVDDALYNIASTTITKVNDTQFTYVPSGAPTKAAQHPLGMSISCSFSSSALTVTQNANNTAAALLVVNNGSGVGLSVSAGGASITGTITLPSLSASLPVKTDGSKNLLAAAINLASAVEVTGTLAINCGGTNSATALTNNQLMISNGGKIVEAGALTSGQLFIGSTNNAPVAATISGTSNQVSVANGAGSITLSTPQNIHTAATPTFAGLTLSANGLSVSAGGASITGASTIINNGGSGNALSVSQSGASTAAALSVTNANASGAGLSVTAPGGAAIIGPTSNYCSAAQTDTGYVLSPGTHVHQNYLRTTAISAGNAVSIFSFAYNGSLTSTQVMGIVELHFNLLYNGTASNPLYDAGVVRYAFTLGTGTSTPVATFLSLDATNNFLTCSSTSSYHNGLYACDNLHLGYSTSVFGDSCPGYNILLGAPPSINGIATASITLDLYLPTAGGTFKLQKGAA